MQKRVSQRVGRNRAFTLSGFIPLATSALLTAHLLVPAEAVAQGETLWLTQIWLGVGLLWAWHAWREQELEVCLDRCDLALWVLIGGQWLSTISVLMTGGDQRSALNTAWMWVGVGIAFFLMRQSFRTAAERIGIALGLIAVTVALSGLGLWQHYVWFPQVAQEYGEKLQRFDELQTEARAAGPLQQQDVRQKLRALEGELSSAGVPLEGTARWLWEYRLRASTEPFGMFALANTFAGLLATVLCLTLGLLVILFPDRVSRWRVVAIGLMACLVFYCLLLTKSRTAWVGLLAAVSFGGVLWFRRRSIPLRRLIMGGLLAALGMAGLVALAAASRGFDREVVLEAPKSLRYRLEYWESTWKVIQESPILGVGPGNFRSHYLKHKLPHASEEIADPHNLVLDVWSTGGVIALAGLLGLLVYGFRHFQRQLAPEKGVPAEMPREVSSHDQAIITGVGLAFPLVFAGQLLLERTADLRLLTLLAGSAVATALLKTGYDSRRISSVASAAAALALTIHLLGAGGIALPALSHLLLLLLVLGTPSGASDRPYVLSSRRLALGLVALVLVLFTACLLTATSPTLNRRSLVDAGDYTLMETGNTRRAEQSYRAAASRDPLSPEPWRRLSELAFRQWQNGWGEFESAVDRQQEAIRRDPYDPQGYQRLGEFHRERFEQKGDRADATAAVEWLRRAVERYPTSAALRAELAQALDEAGLPEQAAEQARMAVELHTISVRYGHLDRYLPDPLLERLKALRGKTAGRTEGSAELAN